MNALLVTDLHLTDNPRDEYRWRIFQWIIETALRCDARYLFILGDLTDAKDYHSSELVNRIVFQIQRLYREGNFLEIAILRANHDGRGPGTAFFRFLSVLPYIRFVDAARSYNYDGRNVLMLPHARKPKEEWALPAEEFAKADFVMAHVTLTGSVSESGVRLQGEEEAAQLLALCRKARIFSGDVHVPQRLGRIEYVGSPYPIRFGDSFRGRGLLLVNWEKEESLFPDFIQRGTIRVASTADADRALRQFKKGDQIKAVVRLSDPGMWQKVKDYIAYACETQGVELCGMELERSKGSPFPRVAPKQASEAGDVLASYIEREKLTDILAEAGVDFFTEAQQ